MRRFLSKSGLAALALVLATSVAGAATISVDPSTVPDESLPRVNVGDFPAGFSIDSWQGPVAGVGNKSNWHARYLSDGDYLSAILPADAATMTINDIEDLCYYTKRPAGTPAGRDWWMLIYTRPTGSGDDASWYHRRYINNYADHTDIGSWVQYCTSVAMTFQRNSGAGGPVQTLAELQAADGGDLIEMISVGTNSGWNGFDGYLDGLEITHTNTTVGTVNFEDVPVVPAARTWGLVALTLVFMSGLAFVTIRNRNSGGLGSA
jgi:hypothetical protein